MRAVVYCWSPAKASYKRMPRERSVSTSPAVNLLIDIGNTRLKWSLAVQGKLVQPGAAIAHCQLTEDRLLVEWRNLPTLKTVAVASVANQNIVESVFSVIQRIQPGVPLHIVQPLKQSLGVVNAYTEPEKLGVDRWLGLVAARHSGLGGVCIADCGTAITIDLLREDGRHLGGLIAPGLKLMMQALHQGTAALPDALGSFPIAPANFTEAAIHSGVVLSAVGLIREVIGNYAPNMQLILTGGDAAQIANFFPANSRLDLDLVLRGLAIVMMEIE
ncbi:MAG: type III pantothenate kinase [Methylobacter sp.]|nr:MAG: type III pantothenate kinase [Methylobacter sp.]